MLVDGQLGYDQLMDHHPNLPLVRSTSVMFRVSASYEIAQSTNLTQQIPPSPIRRCAARCATLLPGLVLMIQLHLTDRSSRGG